MKGRMKVGPSNTYKRLLTGRITPERYAAIVKRWARASLRYPISDPKGTP